MAASTTPGPARVALLPLVARGDVAAIRAVIQAYGGMILAMARRFGCDDPEDAVQEIFVDLWKHAARFDPALAKETTFVMLLARRRLIDRRRKAGARIVARSEVSPLVIDESPWPDVAAEAALAARALERISPDQREVLLLSACHGLSHAEIAAQLQMPLGTVKAHARRGLLAVRAALADAEGAR